MNPTLDGNTPQFGTAEYAGTASGDQCQFCKQMIVHQYYRVNGQMACASCADQAQRTAPKPTHAHFVRALIFGAVGAVIGLIIYSAVGIITGWMIGYVSLAVGYIVGKAMMKGSSGFGGKKYQVAAVLLTYAAVSLSAIPIAVSQIAKKKAEAPVVQQQQQEPSAEEEGQPTQEPAKKPAKSFAGAIAYLALIGLASPFLELADPLHGLIGLVILFVGVQIAWKIAAGRPGVELDGPFDATPA